jgi:hypothetical protein
MSDAQSEGTWVWQDGSLVAWTNWYSGQGNAGSDENDALMVFFEGYNGNWSDANLPPDFQVPFTLCEIRAGMYLCAL